MPFHGKDIPQKYIRGENDLRAISEGCYVDERFGRRVDNFFRNVLRHSKGALAGRPFKLSEFQLTELIYPAYSWRRKDGSRRFRRFAVWLPKKHGKSALMSGLVLYHMTADGERGALIVMLATDREHTQIVFSPAAEMARMSPLLRRMVRPIDSQHRLVHRERGGSLCVAKALSSDVGKGEGWDCSGVIIDEVHAFDNNKGRKRIAQFRYAGAARANPVEWRISTAGDDIDSVGYELFLHDKDILSGEVAGADGISTFVYIAAADVDDDPGDPATWRKSNPMMGVTVHEAELAEAWSKAKGSPQEVSEFKRYRLNIYGSTTHAWLPLDKWDACGAEFDPRSLAGQRCWGGFDIADKTDLSALALCFPPQDIMQPDVFKFLVWFWIPDEKIEERESRDRVKYREFAQSSSVVFTPGPVTDTLRIRDDILKLYEEFHIMDIGFDAVPGRHLANDLYNNHGIPMVEIKQGPVALHPAIVKFEDMVKTCQLKHNRNKVLRRQAQQVQVKVTGSGLLWPVKGIHRTNTWYRIDGIVACLMALARAMEGANASMPLVRAF